MGIRETTRTIRVSNRAAELILDCQAKVRYYYGRQLSAAEALEVLLGLRNHRGERYQKPETLG